MFRCLPSLPWILATMLLAGGCEQVSPRGSAPRLTAIPAAAPRDLAAPPRYSDGPSGVSFLLPAGLSVEVERAPSAEPGQVRHRFTLSSGAASGKPLERLSVEVWDNPRALALDPWFEIHMGFMRDASARIGWAPLGASRARGMLITRPRTGQAHAQRFALLALGGAVLRVTCQDADDPAARAAFDRVSASLRGRP